MRAIVWQGQDRFELQEVVTPKITATQVLVKVDTSSICGTDFHYEDFECVPPIVPGHEIAGTIAEAGKRVSGHKVGDRVTIDPVQRCGRCYCCTTGIEHLCLNARHLGNPDITGGWAEFVAIDAVNVHQIPENVTFEAAALAEPTVVCYESWQRAGLRQGDHVVVMGDGPFGFLHAWLAVVLGAETVVVAGHYDQRLERIAETTGALTCNTHHQELEELLDKVMPRHGCDIVVDAAGSCRAVNEGLSILRPRGSLVVFSYIWKPEPLEMGLIHMNELNVYGSCRSLHAYEPCLELMAAGKIKPEVLVDLRVALEECGQAMQTVKEKKAEIFKAVLKP